jgi:hypothetical protein
VSIRRIAPGSSPVLVVAQLTCEAATHRVAVTALSSAALTFAGAMEWVRQRSCHEVLRSVSD